MRTKVIITRNASETRRLGRRIAENLKQGDIIGFSGDLGAGKTTLIQGIVSALTKHHAASPSFVIVNEYQGPLPVFHFDLYRLRDAGDLETIGWRDYLGRGIILVEWAERISGTLPSRSPFITITATGKTLRKIELMNFEHPLKNGTIHHSPPSGRTGCPAPRNAQPVLRNKREKR